MTSSDADARTILIAGTASHVGKSTVAAGLCRVLSERGVPVAPFKAQNMSNNARAVPVATDDDGGVDDGKIDDGGVDDGSSEELFGEIGVSQYVQARAARIPPTTDHNPVLLKPRGGGESQLVVDGVAVGHYAAESYYDDHWERARTAAFDAHDRLAREYDVVVAEGAGSIAEINLHDRDLANVELARHADAEILLVADIERGGVFASLVGTLALLPDDLRDRVVGAVITKFRGDRSLLTPGLEAFTDRTGVPVLGVIPHEDPGLPEEDSVDLPPPGRRHVRGNDDGVAPDRSVTIAVVRLDHISNFTDLEPLATIPGVRIAYVPPSSDLSDADAVVLPGTKNTVDDLRALHDAGFGSTLRAFEGPVVGICGGYQLLGQRLTNVGAEAVTDGAGDARTTLEGLGLLPVATRFRESKHVVETELQLSGFGPLAGVESPVRGYEIHTGRTTLTDTGQTTLTVGADVAHGTDTSAAPPAISLPFSRPGEPATAELGTATESVLGTYLHGLFENDAVRDGFVSAVYGAAGRNPPDRSVAEVDPYDRAGALLREWIDLDALAPF